MSYELIAVMALRHNEYTCFKIVIPPQVLNPKKMGKKKKKYQNSGTVSLNCFFVL